MATTLYESVVIINAALEDSQIEQAVASVQTNLKSTGGEITETDDWGRKRLAYNINNAKSGYYLINRFNAEPSVIKEFERALKLDENIIRYMTIALDKRAIEHLKTVNKPKPEEQDSKNEKVVEEKS